MTDLRDTLPNPPPPAGRTRPGGRRPGITLPVKVELSEGKAVKVLVTVGFYEEGHPREGKPCEVFCADFKAGTQLHGIIMDACVLMSRLLQHGETADELAAAFSKPPSLLGRIAQAVGEVSRAED